MTNKPQTQDSTSHLSRRRRFFMGGAVVLLVAMIFVLIGFDNKSAKLLPKPQPLVVHAALATRRDVPQYLEGLGTVQALNTVTITPRIDGQLQGIAFKEGQTVKKGDLLAQIDPRPYQAVLESAVATQSKDQAQLDNAKRDLERYLILEPKNLASKQTLDTQRALVAQLDAQIKVDQASVDGAKTQLDYTTITSPIDGRTGIRLVDAGNIVHAADTTGIVVITQLQPISLIFTLPEDSLPQVSEAMAKGVVDITALSQNDKTTLDQGILLLIDNQINQTTGTIKLKATFPNENNTLWPGQFVNARLLLGVRQQALTIPASAAQRGPNGMFVYIVKDDSTVEVRPVRTSIETSDVLLVESGLDEAERVVTSNQYRLQPGSTVQVIDEADKAAPVPAETRTP